MLVCVAATSTRTSVRLLQRLRWGDAQLRCWLQVPTLLASLPPAPTLSGCVFGNEADIMSRCLLGRCESGTHLPTSACWLLDGWCWGWCCVGEAQKLLVCRCLHSVVDCEAACVSEVAN